MLRIVGGKFRGRRLEWISDELTRPTTDRVRENIFNILGLRIRGARVLDLFSGSGAMAAEALSRGAKHVLANDSRPEMARIIAKNLAKMGDFSVKNEDFRILLEHFSGTFDVVFLDAPYKSGFAKEAIDILRARNLLANNAVIVVELDKGEKLELPYKSARSYGRSCVYFLSLD